MPFVTFFTSIFSLLSLNWVTEILCLACLSIDGLIYSLVSYAFRLFLIMSKINFSSLESIISPLINRIEAVILVIIVFKLGISLVGFMINPDKAAQTGTTIIKNIFIVAALLISYNLIFNILNEVSMLFLGVPEGYSFTTLSRIADITDSEDEGLIYRFVFGTDAKVNDIGDFIAYETLSMFVRDTTTETTLANTISDGDGYNFKKLSKIVSKIDKTVEYTPVISGLMGIYIIYSIVTISIEIGIRMFKLLVLQIIAPIAIITLIDSSETGKSQIFSSYVKVYINTYLQAFTRVLSMLIITVFISKFITNIGYFFGEITESGEGLMTRILLTIIVIVAGYKFALELPKFLDSILNTHMGDGKHDGFGKFMTGALGATVGAVAGVATSKGTGFAGGLANMAAGAVTGASAGARGNGIAERIKNINGSVHKDTERAQGWVRQGGFKNAAANKYYNAIGTARRQDNKMYKYDQQAAALKAFEDAQKEEIKDDKISTKEIEGAGLKKENYTSGFDTISYGMDKDSFVDKAIQYDSSLITKQTSYDNLVSSGTASDDDLATAKIELEAAKAKARTDAGAIYNYKKNNANSANITAKRESLESSGADVKYTDGHVDIKATNKGITENKQKLENSEKYKKSHNNPS